MNLNRLPGVTSIIPFQLMPQTIGITGGTGFVGRHLTPRLLAAGHKIVIFSRGKKPDDGDVRYAHWHPGNQEIDTAALHDIDAMVHLAGAGVADKHWTTARKGEIIASRVDATDFLVAQLQTYAPACKTFIAASATGYYGPDRSGHVFTEQDPPFDDFLARVCVAWEEASMQAAAAYRTVIFRFGIVLGKDGGAYPQLAEPMRFGIMPILGSGRQMVSWIHIEDIAGMIQSALAEDAYQGIYNAVAPAPVPHHMLMKTIAKAKGGIKIPAPVPPFVLRMMMGEASVEVLKSCTVSSKRVGAAGFRFRYPEVSEAVKAINDR